MGGEASVIIMLLLMVSTNALEINITKEWKPDYGWELTCFWDTYSNDTLQSVRLANNGNQFIIYRPEKHGAGLREVMQTNTTIMSVNCQMTEPEGRKGFCVLGVEPFQPPRAFVMNCEVSGERPKFRIKDKEIVVRPFVLPLNASLSTITNETNEARVSLNCTSAGLPAPNLLWTVGDDKVPADFTGRSWNNTSKLWHVWSFFTYTPTNQPSTVACLPEVTVNGESFQGNPAEFNSAEIPSSKVILIYTVFLVLHLLR